MSYDEKLLSILANRGVTISAEGKFVRSPTFAGTNPVTDEQLRFINERDSEIEGHQKRQWVRNLVEIVRTLSDQDAAAPWPFMSLFWIRLHGVISELRSSWLSFFRTLGLDPSTCVANAGSPLEVGLKTLRCIEAVRALLTEDELIYADYRRQTEGHPVQSSYSVRWSHAKGGHVLDQRGIPSLDHRQFTVAELDAAVRRVLHAHSINEPAIAVAFARRIQIALGPLVDPRPLDGKHRSE